MARDRKTEDSYAWSEQRILAYSVRGNITVQLTSYVRSYPSP